MFFLPGTGGKNDSWLAKTGFCLESNIQINKKIKRENKSVISVNNFSYLLTVGFAWFSSLNVSII